MATITSATSGPSNVGSTWVGGVVPGTTFSGTRTTTGVAYPVGTTVIALAAGSVAVTANKWLKFAGHSSYHRVTTGIGTGAGSITLTQGLEEAIPASATVVSVDMVDDKVVIAHPGTNSPAAGTQYRMNGAHSAGATTINVNTGSNTILAGECVQFEHQIGTDEDDQPIYDNTYYKVATTLTGGVIVIEAPGLAYAMASGVRVVNRGHVVELVAGHVWGDGTRSLTPISNAVVVAGTLKASRTDDVSLTIRGTLFQQSGGTYDMGATGDVISTGNLRIRLNDDASPSAGLHGMVSHLQQVPSWRIRGRVKTRNAMLTSPTLAGASVIEVDAATDWGVGDELILASATDDPSGAQIVNIAGGAGLVWTVTPSITTARFSGGAVGNFSSNVRVEAYHPDLPAVCAVGAATGATPKIIDVGDFLAKNIGNSAGWVTLANEPLYFGFGLNVQSYPVQVRARRIAARHTNTLASHANLSLSASSRIRTFYDDCACYSENGTSFYPGNNSYAGFRNCVGYRGLYTFVYAFAAGALNGVAENCKGWSRNSVISPGAGSMTMLGGEYRCRGANGSVTQTSAGVGAFYGSIVSAAIRIALYGANSQGKLTLDHCTLSGAILGDFAETATVPAIDNSQLIVAANNIESDNRDLSWYRNCTTDLTTRKRSTYAVRIQPKVANTAITYVFTIPAISGTAQKIKGSLRFDATYGTATPPRIDLSGQGVTQSHTCAATADAWDDFSFSFTPTSTGDITATVTVQSTSTAGFAWLDGIYRYPMTQSVRHYGYQWLLQAAQIVDPRITLTEAQALALPVVVDHVAQTITITGTLTPREVFEATIADLAQTDNQGRAVHITSATGETFATSYTVVGTVSGPYTDAAGLHVAISAPNLIALTRVQLLDVGTGAEIHNEQMATNGFSLPLVWTADRTIRLRAGYAEGAVAKMPIESVGVLTSSGLTFLDAQVDDVVYNAIGLDGGLMTEFAPDYPNLAINVTDPDGVTSVQRLYAWAAWSQTSELGIRLMFRAVQASDTANFQIDQSLVDAKLVNANTAPVMMVGGYLTRKDGSTVIAASSGSIQMDPGKAYVAAGNAAEVWAYATRTLTNGQLLLGSGERVLTLAGGEFVARE